MHTSTQPHALHGNEKPNFSISGVSSGQTGRMHGNGDVTTLEHVGGHPACPHFAPLPGRGSGAKRTLN